MSYATSNVKTFATFKWLDVKQTEKEILEELSKEHGLDVYQIKDISEPGHLPKFERLPSYDFIILRAYTAEVGNTATTITELSGKIAFFYNEEKIISVHRTPFSFMENVYKDCDHPEDVLLYLIRKIVDTYLPPLDELDKDISDIEKIIFLKDYYKVSLEDLYYLKTHARLTKKLLQLLQTTILQIQVKEYNLSALQDIKDRLVKLLLNYDEVLENAHNLLNTYHSVNAQKNNDVMKLLTVFSAFFLPLTFIAGIYGMNFDNMPELRWPNGYYYTLGAMVVICILIYQWFKRKRIM